MKNLLGASLFGVVLASAVSFVVAANEVAPKTEQAAPAADKAEAVAPAAPKADADARIAPIAPKAEDAPKAEVK